MIKLLFIWTILLILPVKLWSQDSSYKTIKKYEPVYYNKSIIKRYEDIADSVFQQGTNLYVSYYAMMDLSFLKNPSLLNKYRIYHPEHRIYIDSNILSSVFSHKRFNATTLLIYDNEGLDRKLDSIKRLVKGLDNNNYFLKSFYNEDSILTGITFLIKIEDKWNKPHKNIFYCKTLHSIKIRYYPDGKLFCYEEKESGNLLKKYKYENEKSRLIYASTIVKINHQPKRLDIDYFKSKILRVFTINPSTNQNDGLVLLGPKRYGKYDNIRIEKNNVWIYEEYNPRFYGGFKRVQSELDKNIYYYYYFNIFGKLQAFSVIQYKRNLEQITTYRLKCGKIKKVEYSVRKYNHQMEKLKP